MRGRHWWVPLAFIVPCAVIALLSATGRDGAMTWVVAGFYGLVVLGVVARALLPSRFRTRSPAEPVVRSMDEYQSIILGQPVLGPVRFGDDAPQATTLVQEDPQPDPGDLRPRND